MLRLREQSRRQICQLTFVALCLAPTVMVLGTGVCQRRPGHSAPYAAQLHDSLGLVAKIGRLVHPRPGSDLYHDLELSDPETGRLVAKCLALETVRSGTSLVLKASSVEVQAEAFDQFWSLVDRWLRRQMVGEELPVRLVADSLTWHGARRSQTFTDVVAQLGAGPQGNEATLGFRLAGTEMPEPATIRVVRHVAEGEPSTALVVSTGSAPLPCTVFSPLTDSTAWLGTRASFHGYLWAQHTGQGWEGEITGKLADVDLDAVVSNHFSHTLSGLVQVHLERIGFRQGRIVEATGSLAGEGGTISRTLWEAGQRHLHLDRDAAIAATQPFLQYQQLALDFILEPQGLKLVGRCPSLQRGTLLADSQGALWVQPAAQPQPVVNLLRMLAPENEIQVPAGEVTELLMRHLPLPPLIEPASPSGVPAAPHTKMRLGATPHDTK